MINRIYLVRHGLSEANIDFKKYSECTDPYVPLSEEGAYQSTVTGEFISNHLEESGLSHKVKVWYSPYLRASSTADGIIKELNRNNFNVNSQESIYLREQEFGILSGKSKLQQEMCYPVYYNYYHGEIAKGNSFFVRPPMGESQADVVQRIQQGILEIERDCDSDNVSTVVIVLHGVSMNALIMRYCGMNCEWFKNEAIANNCSVRFLTYGRDHGYIFDGFPYENSGNF